MSVVAPNDEVKPGNLLLVSTQGGQYSSHVITTLTTAVNVGQRYRLTSDLKPLADGPAGMSIDWIGSTGNRIGLSAQWAPISAEGEVWTTRSVSAVAPPGAISARIELATADGAQALFADAEFRSEATNSRNLLHNGHFLAGGAGWRRAQGSVPLVVQSLGAVNYSAQVSGTTWPPLFQSLRMGLTVQTNGGSGAAETQLSNYDLSLTHQRWIAVKVSDACVTAAVVVLSVLGFILIAMILRRRWQESLGQQFRAWRYRLSSPVIVRSPKVILIVALLLLIYFVGNALLSRIGSLNADIVGARVRGYTAASHGPGSLYFTPNVSTAEAAQWGGLPLQEAGFPYGPIMAYVFSAMGFIYRFMLHEPLVGMANTGAIDFELRAFNALAVIVDIAIIYGVLQLQSVKLRTRRVICLALLFNPAVWYAGSVWGTTQSISIVFLLATVYFSERNSLVLAWWCLLAAFMTRPQSVIPAIILVVYLLRKETAGRTILSIAWAVIAMFIVLVPLSLSVAPSLPIDVFANAFLLHVGHGNDPWTQPASYGAMSIWPLVTQVVGHAHGVNRILYPALTWLFGRHSYYNVGNDLLALSLESLAIVALVRKKRLAQPGQLSLLLATASACLLMLVTGTPGYYFLLVIFLLAMSRPALKASVFWYCLLVVSATTFFSEYGMGAYWLTHSSVWSVGVYDPSIPLTHVAGELPTFDWFITLCCIANLTVLLLLVVNVFRSDRAPGRSRKATGRSRKVATVDPELLKF